jgi:hypothetical protein
MLDWTVGLHSYGYWCPSGQTPELLFKGLCFIFIFLKKKLHLNRIKEFFLKKNYTPIKLFF